MQKKRQSLYITPRLRFAPRVSFASSHTTTGAGHASKHNSQPSPCKFYFGKHYRIVRCWETVLPWWSIDMNSICGLVCVGIYDKAVRFELVGYIRWCQVHSVHCLWCFQRIGKVENPIQVLYLHFRLPLLVQILRFTFYIILSLPFLIK